MKKDTDDLLKVISKISERIDKVSCAGYTTPLEPVFVQQNGKTKVTLKCCYCEAINTFYVNEEYIKLLTSRRGVIPRVYFYCFSCRKDNTILVDIDTLHVMGYEK